MRTVRLSRETVLWNLKRLDSALPLQACLNGARSPGSHPALPLSPEELAADAAEAIRAGASSLHLHPRGADGKETLAAAAVADALAAVRRAAPDGPAGVSTGAWIVPDIRERLACIASCTVLPDFVSVNWHEEGAELVAAACLERGIGIEAGLFHPAALQAWATWRGAASCLRALVELPDGLDEDATAAKAKRMLADLDQTGLGVPVLLHGEGSSCWPALRLAASRGLGTRIGLEDTLRLPDGSPASGNRELVAVGAAFYR
ncbi:hypothetical protein HGI30_14555 [Paenibacillus albicereus]|uniref:3-keto-5-aminohexanoate cleavage protein n=1 Tax=Paenibacillus albicereus TaxID=2726185 RepID=A0A6H2GZ01_9BACL|nr:3-keto-5-aminohexanoate cleavage protein [Paenibacillus albicereus]QJC52663.1 hypothetical protein HGI30_14555 [Paenibacillus albicereus]